MSLRRQQGPCYANAVHLFLPLLLLGACVSEQRAEPTIPDPPAASGWAQAAVPSLSEPVAGCPDQDDDGFPSAWTCPGLPADRADCNDDDPEVSPHTERFVRPGPFVMGDRSREAGWDERPVHPVFLSGYCLDRTEVAAGPYAEWLNRQGRTPASPDAQNPAGDFLAPTHPAEGVTRGEAQAYCASQGKVLPTEAQWEKAARGGCERGSDPVSCDEGDARLYPWGDADPTCALAPHRVTGPRGPIPCTNQTVPVDDRSLLAGAGPYGHVGLAGNVWEWVADAYHPSTYPDALRRNPSGPPSGALGILRGGSWTTFSPNMRVSNRMTDLVLGSAAGFRCARFDHGLNPDAVEPVRLVPLQGTVRREDGGTLVGRAVYVTAFDKRDIDVRSGRLLPGRSPLAEQRFDVVGETVLAWTLEVPQGGVYRLSASLDAGTGQGPAPSGSGGMGEHPALVDANRGHTNLEILLKAAPRGPH